MDHEVCRSCGACCAHLRVGFAAWQTAGRGGQVPDALVEPWIEGHVRMRGTTGPSPRCSALEGIVGRHTTCTIHGRHPVPCRELVPSTPERPNPFCDDARRAHGLAPLSEAVVAVAAPKRKKKVAIPIAEEILVEAVTETPAPEPPAELPVLVPAAEE